MSWVVFVAALGAVIVFGGSAVATKGAVSGVILAFIILSERLTMMFLLASAVIMLGVVLAFRAK